MEENNKNTKASETPNVKENKKAAETKERRSLGSVWASLKGEFDKIMWPSRSDLIKQTFTVMVTSLIIGAVIACLDYLFSFGYQVLVNLFG